MGGLIGLLLAGGAVAAPGQLLTGRWAGDRTLLVADETGATITSDCARGRLAGPIRLDGRGLFLATGSFTRDRPGPQLADMPAIDGTARFAGQVRGDRLDLTIAEGGDPPRRVTLHRGGSVKFVRCL